MTAMTNKTRSPPRCYFPALVSTQKNTSPSQTAKEACEIATRRLENINNCALSQWLEVEGTDALSLLRAAWAVVLRSYTAADHVCFEHRGQGSRWYEAHIAGSTTIRQLLRDERDAMMDCQCRGVDANGGDWEEVSNTSVFVAEDAGQMRDAFLKERMPAVICLCLDRATHAVSLSIKYSHMLLSDDQGRAVVDTLHRTLLEIMAKTSDPVDDIDICSDEDIQRMCDWNAPFGTQPVEEQCAYDIIAQRCRETPDATAISAWDGEMTFEELDRQSTLVALRLLETGVGPEEIVPVYSEKSKWAVVAILGVIKTGAAFVLMAAGSPKNVLHRICHTVSARVMVSSPDCQPTAQGLVEIVVVLDPTSADSRSLPLLPRPHCTPSSALYAVFTSGSTKASKCVVMENRACCESTLKTAPALGLTADTRRLQFSSYDFITSLREILSMLFLGGCLCIPSEADRAHDVAGFINRHRVNFATFCPSLSNIPGPDSVPSLRTLMVGGESPDSLFIELWASKVRLILGFGASETAANALLVGDASSGHDSRNLGRACDSRLWVVNTDRDDRLVPVGAVGELVLQGSGLGRHYLKNPGDTSSQFPDTLAWEGRLVGGPGQSRGRLYKTGDIVKYTWDGSLVFVGRKEQLAKANGRLVDVHEIEHCLLTCRESRKLHLSNVTVVPAKSSTDRGFATQFVAFIGGSSLLRDRSDLVDLHGMLVVPGDKCWQSTSAIIQELSMKLAPDLVPASLIFAKDLPRRLSGKVNRMPLLEMAPTCLPANEQRT